MSADEIRTLSEQLAADPQSLVFIPLAEALLARGDLEHGARVAQRGATRHADRTEAHDLVARIALAQGDEGRAEAAWESVLVVMNAPPASNNPRRDTAMLGLPSCCLAPKVKVVAPGRLSRCVSFPVRYPNRDSRASSGAGSWAGRRGRSPGVPR